MPGKKITLQRIPKKSAKLNSGKVKNTSPFKLTEIDKKLVELAEISNERRFQIAGRKKIQINIPSLKFNSFKDPNATAIMQYMILRDKFNQVQENSQKIYLIEEIKKT
ncbi:MAG: hypothetical protein V1824_03245, partial [archaeon]